MKGATAMDFEDDDPIFAEGANYASRQRERDDDYRRAYDEWVGGMSLEDRRQLEGMGLEKAYLPCGSGGAVKDAAESSRARCEAEAHALDEGGAEAPPAAVDGEELHDLLRRLVGELVSQSNARLSLECLALVTGLVYCGDSMTEIAKRHGVTRAAVSKRCVELTQALNLKPSRAMRSLLARQSYRKARLQRLHDHS
ncbi:MAG: hypothetical protein KDK97_14925 [Verrucomicrobiales bacterium]|nr:hypothetical protein [Verrucomicrobiales bacterium]